MKKMCCNLMKYHTTNHCTIHKSPYECPDCLVIYDEENQCYGIIIHDGGNSYIRINYCPWCGSVLSSKNEVQN